MERPGKKKLRARWLAAIALSVAMPGQALAQGSSFNLPARDLGGALTELARQSSREIHFSADLTRGLRAPALSGRMSVEEALGRLLAGSGLRYRINSTGAIVVERASGEADAGSAAADNESADPIIVTGSNIRGADNRTVPINRVTRRDIEESGYSSTEQMIQSLPQNYAGGQNGASEYGRFGNASAASFNIGSASGVNLRGLGTTSTLTLIEGRRVASAIQGTAVDVSLIPLGAVERIDVLLDGASAIYGSDAIAGVVNIVLRDDFEGFETRARFGTVTDGPTREYLLSQSAGTRWASGNVFGTVQYRSRGALPTSARAFSETALRPNDLLPENEDISAMASLRQELGSGLELFAFGLFTDKSSERNQRSQVQTSVQDTDSRFYGISTGLRWDAGGSWEFELSGTLSRQHDENVAYYTVGRPAGYVDGTPAVDNRFRTWSLEARGSGTLIDLPGGPLRIAFGGSWREETASYRTSAGINLGIDRSAGSLFAETYIPLVGPGNTMPLVERLEVSAAVRYDDYSAFGNTINPRFGLFWSPHHAVGLRGSYSTSFRVPSVSEEFLGTFNSNVIYFQFQRAGGGVQPGFLLTGGGEPLVPETAENLTAGLVLTPAFVEGLTVTLDYFDIDFRNRIIVPPVNSAALIQPDVYGSLVTPFADDAAALAFLNARIAEGYSYFGPPGIGHIGVRGAYSALQQNAARVRQRGLDVRVAMPFSIGAHRFRAQANLAYLDRLSTAFTASSTPAEVLNTYGNPLRYRARGSLSWTLGTFNASASLNYSGSYRDTAAIPPRGVEAWTTADLTMAYTPPWLRNVTFALSALNLFDDDPPRVRGIVNGVFFDAGNATPLGRFVSFEARVRW
jgi:iron complex outermembrane recepter protein